MGTTYIKAGNKKLYIQVKNAMYCVIPSVDKVNHKVQNNGYLQEFEKP